MCILIFNVDGTLSCLVVHCSSSCPVVWSTHRWDRIGISSEYKTLLDFTATPIFQTLTDAQEVIRNFQVANRNSTHITFTWDIVDGYYSSSYISYFYLYYRQRSGSRGYSNSIYIDYSNSDLIKFGASFKYTRAVTTFSTYGQYVMSVYVYRSSLTPTGVYSDEVYVEVGMWTNVVSYWCKRSSPCLLHIPA